MKLYTKNVDFVKGRGFMKGGFLFGVMVLFLSLNTSYGQESRFSPGSTQPQIEPGKRGYRISPKIPQGIRGTAMERPPRGVPLEEIPFPLLISATPGDTFVDIKWAPVESVKIEEFQIEEPVEKLQIEEPVEKLQLEEPVEEAVRGYIIFYGTESRKYTNEIDVGEVSSFRVRNLENYTPYFFSVKAYTESKGLSGFSNEVKAIPKPEEELKSAIERIFSEEIPQEVTKDLTQFGYDLFSSPVSSFAPVTDVPVGPDYVVGPGDSFMISLWGRVEARFSVKVDRSGEISLPKIGTLKVWGLRYSELKKYLLAEFSKHYKGFQMNVVMGRLRTIRVFVIGEVVTPGSYTLSSLSTVYNALFTAGGPSKRGTMRNIQLIRNGSVIKIIDLYDFLLKGDKSQDERIQSGDTIFIPVIGTVVGITGNVKRPAIYEIKKTLDLEELIAMAGGVTPIGYLQRVQIERIVAHEKKVVEDFDLAEYSRKRARLTQKVMLQDGDLVKIFPILPTTRSIVYLEGHVQRPGGYEFKEGMKLLDLIPSFDELLPEPYLEYADIIRLVPPDFHPEPIPFDLGDLLKGDLSQNIELQEYDRVTVYSREKLREVPQVTVGGEVQNPGKYRLLENMRVKDLIYYAGNIKRSGYLPEAEVTRLIKTAQGVSSKIIHINLGEALKENPEHNIVLEEDDYLFIRQIPEWYTDKTITLEGEVKFPGVYSLPKGEMLSSVLERAGGFTEYAYIKGAFFTRESAKRAQEERLKGFIDRLEEDILRTQSRVAEAATRKTDVQGLEQALAVKRELLEKTKAAQATGRVVIRLESLDTFKGSKYDLELEDGDMLSIPKMPGIVNVMGSVYNPTSIVYTKGKTIGYYLSTVGGPTPDAEEGEMYLVKADGSVISKTQKGAFAISWEPEGKRWVSGGFMSARVNPGDTILVPSKVTRFVWKRELMDWTTILYQIAVTAGVMIAAF